MILVTALIGIGIGWLGSRRLGMNDLETIVNICFAVGGAWIANALSLHFAPVVGTPLSVLGVFCTIIGAVVGVGLYKLLFHPHGGNKPNPLQLP